MRTRDRLTGGPKYMPELVAAFVVVASICDLCVVDVRKIACHIQQNLCEVIMHIIN